MRSHLAQIRSGILPLNIEMGRHRSVELKDRKCNVCTLDEVEDELHFLCRCPLYAELCRELYNNMYVQNSNFYSLSEKDKFIHILQICSKSVGRFVVNSFEKRRKSLYK